ncbi:TenA family transcriptional regulator [Janthinobacterium agaricidamnosum]|uniref:TENA/THI-4/PQQC family protein n=1 Tax=Janthinobacterium agaricidamnosum NBRC 102515 = DSM 9628 TaxID=1349767 RepID=W0V2Y2_9BURK|nr:iron-containing redox enzyme family protein [Janthinobacterium agaricidamnosum]CDG81718.1 putative uncharacterized protein [Janthinobacterium agaricidamnosum NBRC 102515 = DSM 9628]
MSNEFKRRGPLKEAESYPPWLQQVLRDTSQARQLVAGHGVFAGMRDARLGAREFYAFFVNGWPVVEQFPQYMAMNLLKARFGRSEGEDMARRYLTRNIRVEQNHADYWVDWAGMHDVSKSTLLRAEGPPAAFALSHWCWSSSSADLLAQSMAATNYAIEGVTGDWATLVCSASHYEDSFPAASRKKAMRWLQLHAHYDDAHPWEALDIVATLLGSEPSQESIDGVRNSILTSFSHFKASLDCCV